MNEYIKTTDSDIAERLKALGFNYVKESINGKDVYCFHSELALLSCINNQRFRLNSFAFDTKRCF